MSAWAEYFAILIGTPRILPLASRMITTSFGEVAPWINLQVNGYWTLTHRHHIRNITQVLIHGQNVTDICRGFKDMT